jgi:hypothetical protein
VRITGTNLSDARYLTWSPDQGGIWDAWQFINYGPNPPDNAVYDVQVIDAAGTYTYQRVINGGIAGFPANLAPTGLVGGNVVFTFTAAQGAAAYTVQVYRQGQPGNVIWFVHGVPGTAISYAGPALTPGVIYGYDVVGEFQTENGRNNSAASAQFTYVLKGDVSGNGEVNLADAILALQVIAGRTAAVVRIDYAASGTDVDGNGKVGPAEVIYILQAVSGLR